MEQRLRQYVDALFTDMPNTARAAEVRDEIYANVLDRYHDLVSSGLTPQEAFEEAKRSIGNTDDIRRYLEESSPDYDQRERYRQRRAALTGVGVGCVLLGVGFLILLTALGEGVVGVFLLFVFLAVGVGLIIYGQTAYAPRREEWLPREEATEYQQWKAEKLAGERRTGPYRSLLWLIVTILYFLISFTTGAWGISWIIFLIGAAVEKLIEVVTT